MAPFELLPNEMAEIPIKLAMAKMHRPLQKYEFLANVIAKISTRQTSERANGECACGHIFGKFSQLLFRDGALQMTKYDKHLSMSSVTSDPI